uniref:Uncharacterized protein n=1 Tax=Cyprinodon variegatus TaxID=28743 RepID=A0A3Q2EFE5_CYPVA
MATINHTHKHTNTININPQSCVCFIISSSILVSFSTTFSTDIIGVGGCLPVLRIFLMTAATWPFSIELSNLTMQTRQEHRTSRESASKMRPTARSDRFTFTKM